MVFEDNIYCIFIYFLIKYDQVVILKKEDVKMKILKAAISEFSEKGYLSASTNSIHKAAGVSKGAVFAHFKSKAELFYQAFKYCTDLVFSEFRKHDFGRIEELFERLIAVTYWKLDFFSKNPEAFRIIKLALSESPPELQERIGKDLEGFVEVSGDAFFTELDAGRFSSEYSEEEVRLFFKIALEGLQSHFLKKVIALGNYEEYKDFGLKYLKTLLKGMEK